MGKLRESISWARRHEKILIMLFCAVIAIAVAAVLIFVYEPNQNALGALGTVCMDVLCIFVLICLVISLTFEKEKIYRTTRLFLLLMIGTIYALFFDFLNWAFDGVLTYAGWTYIFTLLSLCMGSVLACMFVIYLYSYMKNMYEMKAPVVGTRICIICNILSFVITFILGITKNAFYYVDGHYVTGELYDYITAIPVLTLIYMTLYAVFHVKIMGIHDVLAVVGYISTMIIGALIESTVNIGATYVSVTIADIFIFLMLQNKSVERLIRKSNTDELTGFLNRNAYEDDIVALEKRGLRDNFVYISIDINSLKVVNDSLGHEAGDELIIGACECIRQCFGSYGRLYRIGGDEFTALIYADATELEQIKTDLEETINKWNGRHNKKIAISCGYVSVREFDAVSLHQMAVLADKRMYEEKARYYQTSGMDRRGISANYEILSKIHPDDVKDYLDKTCPEYISDYFSKYTEPLCLNYRKKSGDAYNDLKLTITPAEDYSDKCPKLIFEVTENTQGNMA